jgi:maltose alpha-D-glucosyltransferase/alpha-amylase
MESTTDTRPASIDTDLLRLFIVEKAAYEICYELSNRPDWVDVPLRGLLDTLADERAHEGGAAH